MANARVFIHDEVTDSPAGRWQLCFQRCTYNYGNGSAEDGLRFIWRRPDGSLQPARGQARIPNSAHLLRLMALASEAGWLSEPTPAVETQRS
jgi:hypothetical protein